MWTFSASLNILWFPGHHGVEKNKIVDMLAKQAACLNFAGREAAIGLPIIFNNEQLKCWQITARCHQAKMSLDEPDKNLTHCALELRKRSMDLGWPANRPLHA